MTVNSVAIIGGGMSGFTVAKELRSRGFEGEITVVDPEGLPYDRPPLSKDYLLGTKTLEQIQFMPQEWFDENSVKLIHASAVGIEADGPTIKLNNGETLTADRIVLATGGSARKLPIPGGELTEVLELRTQADADRLRASINEGTRVLIVGAGLIGAETASSLLALGAKVTLVDPAETPLVPAVGLALAQYLHAMHTDKGIELVQGAPERIELDGDERVVTLADGTTLRADQVLVGIGIIPNTSLAEDLGLETDNGVIVDESQQTSNPAVYAVGDAARIRTAEGELLRRAEHWENAMNSGATAAAAILGQDLPQHGAAWFWSDRHGVHVEGVGSLVGDGEYVQRLNEDGTPQATFLVNPDGTMAGCAAVDGGLTVRAARRIIDKKIVVPVESLADSSIPLKKLAR